MKKVRSLFAVVVCLALIGALIAGCGGSSKKTPSNPSPSPTPTSGTDLVTREINPTEELVALQTLGATRTYKGFTFDSDVAFDNNTSAKNYSGDQYSGSYIGRIKLGGTTIGKNSITFSAKAGGKLDMLAVSSSSSDSTRHLMVASKVGDDIGIGTDLGAADGKDLKLFTYNIPADGDYVIYAEGTGGINIFYIHIIGIVDSTEPTPTATATATPTPTPPTSTDWTGAALDIVGTSGTAPNGSLGTNTDTSVTLTASGGSVKGDSRRHYFVYKQATTTGFVFTARVASITVNGAPVGAGNEYRFGMLVTTNIAPVASYADSGAWGSIGFYYKDVDGSPALLGSRAQLKTEGSQSRSDATLAEGNWLRIEVAVDGTSKRIKRFSSADGVSWTQLNSTTDFKSLPTDGNWYYGFYGAPGANEVTMTFDNISFETL